MKKDIEVVIKKYENQECFTSDFVIESIAKKAYSGEKEKVERLIKHLEINHPGQIELIGRLKKHLLPESELTQTPESASEPEAKQEPSQEPNAIPDSVSAVTNINVSEAVAEQIESNETSSQERQYHVGMEYEINPDDKVDIHPAAETMPMMDGESIALLAEDIKTNGQLVPILTINGKLIDGRNRLKACRLLGIPAKAKEIADTTDAVAHVVSLNMNRRQLTKQQRATAAVLLIPKFGKLDLAPNQKTRDVLAKKLGVSTTYFQNAKAVYDNDKALFERVRNESISLKKAYNRVKPKQENTATSPAWISSFVNILNIISEDKKDDLRVVLNSSTGKSQKLIQDKLNTFVMEDFDTQTKNIDTKIMEKNNGH